MDEHHDPFFAWAIIVCVVLSVLGSIANGVGEMLFPSDSWAPADYYEYRPDPAADCPHRGDC